MCGIAGFFNFKTDAPADPVVLRRMTRTIQYRGPDAEGHHVSGALGLGHRRLSILDLSDRGRNPMFSSDGRYAIVYNGEVYNYIELRAELVALGAAFHTDTDTEVILQAFIHFGPDCLTKLNGMFAFAIWDASDRALFCARDRVGIKPFYYALTADGFVFASEAKAILAHPGVPATPRTELIPAFLAFGYMPTSGTLFSAIEKLPPGHAMMVSSNGIRQWQYWDVHFEPNEDRSIEATTGELRRLLEDAAAIHMRSDVPVGVFLSGGLDSTALVSVLSSLGFSNLHTFAVAYEHGQRFDETRFASLVARRFNTTHRVLYVDPKDFAAFIPQFVWHMDEPVAEGAALSLYFISRVLREHVTVALSGEGADELFAGYDIYRYMRWLDRYHSFPSWLRRCLMPLFRASSAKLQKYALLAEAPLRRRYLGVPQYASVPDGVLSRSLRAAADGFVPSSLLASFYSRVDTRDALSQMLYVDFKTWLPDDLLIKADRMTMANSVELRVPFLDYRLVEFAASVPSRYKQRGANVKWILKQALADILPPEILARKKMGFPTPLADMFRQGLSGQLRETLLAQAAVSRGYIDAVGVERLIGEHERGAQDHSSVLWRLLLLEEWHRQFIDGAGISHMNRFSDGVTV